MQHHHRGQFQIKFCQSWWENQNQTQVCSSSPISHTWKPNRKTVEKIFVLFKNWRPCRFSGNVFLSSMKMNHYLGNLPVTRTLCEGIFSWNPNFMSYVHSFSWTGVPQQQERQMVWLKCSSKNSWLQQLKLSQPSNQLWVEEFHLKREELWIMYHTLPAWHCEYPKNRAQQTISTGPKFFWWWFLHLSVWKFPGFPTRCIEETNSHGFQMVKQKLHFEL